MIGRRCVTAVVLVAASLAGTAIPAAAATAVDVMQAAAQQGISDGYPAVIGVVRQGSATNYVSAGVGDLTTNVAADPTAQVRIGSITKTFIAATMLLLESEGRLSLNDTVATWLPGVVNANGNDGTKITLRELLNMTSGLPEYIDKLPSSAWTSDTQYTPQDLVNLAISSPPTGPPGGAVNYTNTGYILAGMVIQAVTGNDPSVEVTNDIINPLGLTGTSYPTTDHNLYGNYLHGYEVPPFWIGVVPYTDVTVLNPTVGPAAGGMVSTENDVATFYRALMSGNLLPPAQLQELKTGVQEGTTNNYSALGIESIATSCGQMWAKDGAVPGYNSLAATSEDGSKQIVVTGTEYNLYPGSGAAHLLTALENAFCAS